jgi:hypothetical protein
MKNMNLIEKSKTYSIDSNGNLSGLSGLDNFCFYMVPGPNGEEAYYYYDSKR